MAELKKHFSYMPKSQNHKHSSVMGSIPEIHCSIPEFQCAIPEFQCAIPAFWKGLSFQIPAPSSAFQIFR